MSKVGEDSPAARLSPQAAATRGAILEAACACFAERGPAATTTRQIASRAGVTQPLVHHYFGSKDGLFEQVLEAIVADYDETQAEQWRRPMDDLGFWTQGLTVLFWWLGERPDINRLAAWARLEGRDAVNAGMRAVFERVRERVEHGQRVGIVRADVDVDVALLVVDAAFKGFWDRLAEYGSYPIDDAGLAQRYLAQALRTLLGGLLTPDAAREAFARLEAEGRS